MISLSVLESVKCNSYDFETVKSVLSGKDVKVCSIGLPDEFIEHGKQNLIREKCGISVENIKKAIYNL